MVNYSMIVLSGDGSTEDCAIEVTEGDMLGPPGCIYWFTDTIDTIGWCGSLAD